MLLPHRREEAFQVAKIGDGGAQLRAGAALRPCRPVAIALQKHPEKVVPHLPQGGVELGLRDVHQERLAEDREILPEHGIEDRRDGGRNRLRRDRRGSGENRRRGG